MQDFFFFSIIDFTCEPEKTPRTLSTDKLLKEQGGGVKLYQDVEASRITEMHTNANFRKEQNLAKSANYIFHATHHLRFAHVCVCVRVAGGGKWDQKP